MRHETAEEEEEVRSVLKEIAATGKFWYVYCCYHHDLYLSSTRTLIALDPL